MLVSTLANMLDLPENASKKMCLDEIGRRVAFAATRSETQQEDHVKSLDETKAALARLQIKHGIEPDADVVKRHLLATEIRPGVFRLGNKQLTAEELEQAMQADYDEAHMLDDVLDEPIRGESVDKAARQLLGQRGIWSPTSEEYLSACEEIGVE